MTLFFFPPVQLATFGIILLENITLKKSTKGKIIIAGKHSKHWETKAVSLKE